MTNTLRRCPVSFNTVRLFRDAGLAARRYGRHSVGHSREQKRAVYNYLVERAARNAPVMDSADLARANID